jgi:hypothetical protein
LLYVTVLVLAIGLVAASPVEGVPTSGLENALVSLEMVVSGVIVALMYYSPVRIAFERRAPVV